MSLEPFHTLEEEHGQLDGDSKAANDVSVQSKFTAFFSVVIGVHSVMFVFALVFIFSEDGDAPQFAECVVRQHGQPVPRVLPGGPHRWGQLDSSHCQWTPGRQLHLRGAVLRLANVHQRHLLWHCLPDCRAAVPPVLAGSAPRNPVHRRRRDCCSVPGACERNFPHRLRSLPWPVLPDANAAGRPGECVLASRLMKGCVRVSAFACAGEK